MDNALMGDPLLYRKKTQQLSDEHLSEMFKRIRSYHRNHAIKKFTDRSHLFRMFDPRPDEVRNFFRFHCRDPKLSLIRIRSWVSWHKLSIYAKKGWKGLLIPGALLPVSFLLNLSGVSGDKLNIDSPMHWIVPGSVLLLVFANLLFKFGCPRVVKWAMNKEEYLSSANPTYDLITETKEMLLNETTIVPITTLDLNWLKNDERESAIAQINAGYPCFRAGLTPTGRYLVEKIILAAAKAEKISTFVRSDAKEEWRTMKSTGFIFPANPLSVWIGIIGRDLKYNEMSDSKKNDFLLQWNEADSRMIQEYSISSILPDIECLFTKDTYIAILEELAQWSSYNHPRRRLLTAGLYILSSTLLVGWIIIAMYSFIAPAI